MRWVTAAAIALALAGCGKRAELAVRDAWVRLPAVPGRPAAAYFTLHGGAADATLVRVATPAAHAAELHESMANAMRSLPSVAVPAGTEVKFAPAGRHVMLFDLDPRLATGKTASLRLTFADGRALQAEAKVVGPADPAP